MGPQQARAQVPVCQYQAQHPGSSVLQSTGIRSTKVLQGSRPASTSPRDGAAAGLAFRGRIVKPIRGGGGASGALGMTRAASDGPGPSGTMQVVSRTQRAPASQRGTSQRAAVCQSKAATRPKSPKLTTSERSRQKTERCPNQAAAEDVSAGPGSLNARGEAALPSRTEPKPVVNRWVGCLNSSDESMPTASRIIRQHLPAVQSTTSGQSSVCGSPVQSPSPLVPKIWKTDPQARRPEDSIAGVPQHQPMHPGSTFCRTQPQPASPPLSPQFPQMTQMVMRTSLDLNSLGTQQHGRVTVPGVPSPEAPRHRDKCTSGRLARQASGGALPETGAVLGEVDQNSPTRRRASLKEGVEKPTPVQRPGIENAVHSGHSTRSENSTDSSLSFNLSPIRRLDLHEGTNPAGAALTRQRGPSSGGVSENPSDGASTAGLRSLTVSTNSSRRESLTLSQPALMGFDHVTSTSCAREPAGEEHQPGPSLATMFSRGPAPTIGVGAATAPSHLLQRTESSPRTLPTTPPEVAVADQAPLLGPGLEATEVFGRSINERRQLWEEKVRSSSVGSRQEGSVRSSLAGSMGGASGKSVLRRSSSSSEILAQRAMEADLRERMRRQRLKTREELDVFRRSLLLDTEQDSPTRSAASESDAASDGGADKSNSPNWLGSFNKVVAQDNSEFNRTLRHMMRLVMKHNEKRDRERESHEQILAELQAKALALQTGPAEVAEGTSPVRARGPSHSGTAADSSPGWGSDGGSPENPHTDRHQAAEALSNAGTLRCSAGPPGGSEIVGHAEMPPSQRAASETAPGPLPRDRGDAATSAGTCAETPATPRGAHAPATAAAATPARASAGSTPGTSTPAADSPSPPHPKAGEDGMPRDETLLHKLEMEEFQKCVRIAVPEGLGPDRRVEFTFGGRQQIAVIPEGLEVGQEVRVLLNKSAPLPRNAHIAAHQPYPVPGIRAHVAQELRHIPSTPRGEALDFNHPTFTHRRGLYHMLRGQCMDPMVGNVEEAGNESFEADRSIVEDPLEGAGTATN